MDPPRAPINLQSDRAGAAHKAHPDYTLPSILFQNQTSKISEHSRKGAKGARQKSCLSIGLSESK